MVLDAKKSKIFRLYGTASDEVCYAHERLQKLGVKPYTGKYNGRTEDILRNAIAQAKKDGHSVSVFLNNMEVNGLFVVSPAQAPAELSYSNFVQNAAQKRWDKPIEQQKKEEEFDKFKDYKYAKTVFDLYGTASDEVCYAHERLQKLGVKPYTGKYGGKVQDIFADAVKESNKRKQKVSIFLNSSVVQGLFVISPDDKANDLAYCQKKFEEYVRDQKKLRWDKPIEQQKIEERTTVLNTVNKVR